MDYVAAVVAVLAAGEPFGVFAARVLPAAANRATRSTMNRALTKVVVFTIASPILRETPG
jgi:hypothetical protein